MNMKYSSQGIFYIIFHTHALQFKGEDTLAGGLPKTNTVRVFGLLKGTGKSKNMKTSESQEYLIYH